MKPLTKTEARAFRKRWQLVNAREEQEMRTASMELKWRQLNTLMAWAKAFDWTSAPDKEVAEVRRRWARLRKAYFG